MLLLDPHNAAVSESRLLHTDPGSYVCISGCDEKGTWRDRFYQARLIAPAICSAQNTAERYISQASYMRRSRTTCHINSIRMAFVDFDCVAILGHEPDDEFIQLVLDRAFGLGLPRPSLIVRSGRGFHAKWIFHEPVGPHQLPSWKALNTALVDIFSAIGGDTQVKDASRVLRVIGSINSLASEPFRRVCLVHDSGELVDFDQLFERTAAAYAEMTIEKASRSSADPAERRRGERRIRQMAQLIAAHPTNLKGLQDYQARLRPLLCNEQGFAAGEVRHKSLRGLNWRRFVDLRQLIQMRGGAAVGSRDLFVFWMLNHLALSGQVSSERFAHEAQELIRHFPRHDGFDPLGTGQLSCLIDRLAMREAGTRVLFNGTWYDPMYTPTNDYLINTFAITDEEQRSLVTIISAGERERRAILKDPRVAGRIERREMRRTRTEEIRTMGSDCRKNLNRALNRSSASATELIQQVEAGLVQAKAQLQQRYHVSERQARRVVQQVADQTKEHVLTLVRAWRAAGMLIRDIAQRVGRSQRQVLRWLAQALPCGAPSSDGAAAQSAPEPLLPSLVSDHSPPPCGAPAPQDRTPGQHPPSTVQTGDGSAPPSLLTLRVQTGDTTDSLAVTNGSGPLVLNSQNILPDAAQAEAQRAETAERRAEVVWQALVAQKEAAEHSARLAQTAKALASLLRAVTRTGNTALIERMRERIAQSNPQALALVDFSTPVGPSPATGSS